MELNYAQVTTKGFPQPPARVYLIQGGDDALKREAVERLTKPLLDPDFADFDREERDIAPTGESEDARAILASAMGVPMASARRVVIRTNAQRLGKDEQNALAAGLEKLGALSCLILVAGAPVYDAGKLKADSAVNAKLAGAVAKIGVVVLCDPPGEGDLVKRANALLKARGKTMEPAALDVILARARAVAGERGGGGKAGDIAVLTNELEKAVAFAGERAVVTRADAVAVGVTAVEDNIFALLDAVGSRDARRALHEADEVLRTGDRPDGVAARTFVMLARHLRLLWGAKQLGEAGISAANVKGGLPSDVSAALSGEMAGLAVRQSYLLRGLQQQARGWTYPALRRALARVLASDLAMKGIPAPTVLDAVAPPGEDPASGLRLLVVELCRTA